MKKNERKGLLEVLKIVIPSILSGVLAKIGELFVEKVFAESKIADFFNKNISFKVFIPLVIFFVVAIICLIISLLSKREKNDEKKFFSKKEKLESVLRETVEFFPDVESIQAYEYTIKSNQESKNIITRFYCGIADEEIDINCIMQSYYYFPHSIYKKMEKFVKAYFCAQKSGVGRKEKEYLEIGRDLLQKLLEQLNSIHDENSIAKFHCEMYRMTKILLSILNEEANQSILQDEKIERAILQKKRSGILGTILLGTLYIFTNENSKNKKRAYFSFPIKASKGKELIIIAAVNDGHVAESNKEKEMDNLCEEVMSFVENKYKTNKKEEKIDA